MKLLTFKFILLFIYLLSSSTSYAIQQPNLENFVIYKEPKKLEKINFYNVKNEMVDLSKFKNSLVVINFWATWCAPCKEEMPSLDKLHAKDGIFVFPINLEDKNLKKTDKFYDDLNITNLNIYFDEGLKLTKAFFIRGVPTTIIFNKNKDEVARIKGSVDFSDKKFISWLESIE